MSAARRPIGFSRALQPSDDRAQVRVIPGTALAAYGHGDWNDSLQPADPAMRERMCSAWTVTLHFQALVSLASVLRAIGRTQEADRFLSSAEAIRQDFQRLLVVEEDARTREALEIGLASTAPYTSVPRSRRAYRIPMCGP